MHGPEDDSKYLQQISAERGSAVYAVLHGDMHIRNGVPLYRFEKFNDRRLPIEPDRARSQPSRLLRAESKVVEFSGRTSELNQLGLWRDGTDESISTLLMYGPAGQGKSRLSDQFAVLSLKEGWNVWTAHHVSDPTPEKIVIPGPPGRNLLLIVDYADRWPIDDLQLLVQNPVLMRPRKVKIVLIARSAGFWWRAIRHRFIAKINVAVADPIQLGPVADELADKVTLYRSARLAFSRGLGIDEPAHLSLPNLSTESFDQILTLHMAALVDVDSSLREVTPPTDPVGLSSYLFDREHDYWQSLYENNSHIEASPEVIARVAYVASLTGVQPPEEAALIVEHTRIAEGPEVARALRDHSVCYPPDRDGMFLFPLYPDRLAEDFIALYSPGHDLTGFASDEWADSALFFLLVGGSTNISIDLSGSHRIVPTGEHYGETSQHLRSAMLRFIYAAKRWPHLVSRQLNILLDAWPSLALIGGNSALIALAETPGVDPRILLRVQHSLPDHFQARLAVGAAAIAQRTAEYLIPTVDDNQRADIHIRLGRRLSEAGIDDEAMEETKKGVEILETFIGEEDYRYRTRLAAAFGFLADDLFKFALYDDALSSIDRALELWQCLEAVDVDAYFGHAALALDQRVKILAHLGRNDEAEEAAGQAMHFHERLAKRSGSQSSDHRHGQTPEDRAGVLVNTAILYSKRGRLSEAIELVRQGVDILRQIVRTDREADHEPNLAAALNNLSNYLSRDGKHVEALAISDEAIEIMRRLAREDPRLFDVQLSETLYNGALRHCSIGRTNDGMAMTVEAVDLLRGCANRGWDVYGSRFLRLLTAGSELSFTLGEYQVALDWSREAVDVLDRPDLRGPVIQTQQYVDTMIMFALIRSRLGLELEIAASIAGRVKRRLEELASTDPGQFGVSLEQTEEILGELRSAIDTEE